MRTKTSLAGDGSTVRMARAIQLVAVLPVALVSGGYITMALENEGVFRPDGSGTAKATLSASRKDLQDISRLIFCTLLVRPEAEAQTPQEARANTPTPGAHRHLPQQGTPTAGPQARLGGGPQRT